MPPRFALPLPPFCMFPALSSPSRPCSADESVPPRAVADTRWPTLPWAFVPLQGPSRSDLLLQVQPLRRARICNREATDSGVRVRPGVPLVAAIPRGLEPKSNARAVLDGVSRASRQAASSLTPGGPCPFWERVESMSPSSSTGPYAAPACSPEGANRCACAEAQPLLS